MLNNPKTGYIILNILVLSVIIYIITTVFIDMPKDFDVSKLISRNIFFSAAILALILASMHSIKLLFLGRN